MPETWSGVQMWTMTHEKAHYEDDNYSRGLAEAKLKVLSPQAQVRDGGRGKAEKH